MARATLRWDAIGVLRASLHAHVVATSYITSLGSICTGACTGVQPQCHIVMPLQASCASRAQLLNTQLRLCICDSAGRFLSLDIGCQADDGRLSACPELYDHIRDGRHFVGGTPFLSRLCPGPRPLYIGKTAADTNYGRVNDCSPVQTCKGCVNTAQARVTVNAAHVSGTCKRKGRNQAGMLVKNHDTFCTSTAGRKSRPSPVLCNGCQRS